VHRLTDRVGTVTLTLTSGSETATITIAPETGRVK